MHTRFYFMAAVAGGAVALSGGGEVVMADSFSEGLFWAREEEPQGTRGGPNAQNAWATRVLNTLKENRIAGASLANNRVSLPAGDYVFVAAVGSYYAGAAVLRIYDVTNAVELAKGVGANSDVSNQINAHGFFTLAGPAEIELQWFTSSSTASTRGGNFNNTGTDEVHGSLMLWKV